MKKMVYLVVPFSLRRRGRYVLRLGRWTGWDGVVLHYCLPSTWG